ncbi:MAG: hypothetical protein HFG22_14810 [Lachnospiraceae bacterium]|nr:hypothetical protein [Lachnospiraceae bacterium]
MQIDEQTYPAFYLQLKKSILASLEKQGLLTHPQYSRCVEEIERRYHQKNHSQA